MKKHPNRYLQKISKYRLPLFILIIATSVLLIIFLGIKKSETEKTLKLEQNNQQKLMSQLIRNKAEFSKFKKIDQIMRSDDLERTIKEIQQTFSDSVTVYESLIEIPSTSKEIPNYRKQFAKVLKYLSDKNYSSGAATLKSLKSSVEAEKASLLSAPNGIDTTNLTKSTTPPGSGYSRQLVEVNGGTYVVDIVAGNLSSTKVIVDTASDNDCTNDCPTLPLGNYVTRNGAYAGINGSYFCPAEYPSCAGKTNSFDTLAMNNKKHYFNSDNNVYSTVPAVIFGSGFVRFIGRSLDWGRDTGVDGVLANQPLLISEGNVAFGGDGDPKKGSRGNRSFVANRGNIAYIGVIRNVTVTEAALILKAMSMENALNLDSGGSTALWASGGYKVGPGRNIPNSVLFVNR